MSVRRLLVVGVAAFLPLLSASANAQSMTPDQRAALDAAERWLVPVDAARYPDSYSMASEEFKAGVARQQYQDGIRGIRKDYGKLVARKAEKMGYVGEPPKPDGELQAGAKVVIVFASKFAGDKAASEEMTMVYEKDGVWRMASYYIR